MMIYNKYDPLTPREDHATDDPPRYIKERIESQIKPDDSSLRLFGAIEIETINRCNLSCPFCPAGRAFDKRDFALMSEKLFEKIIQDLKKKSYKGKVALYSNNEPFLDQRLPVFLQYTKQELPEAQTSIYTNGSLLTLETFLAVMKNLDSMVIDHYSDDLQLSENVREIYDYCVKTGVYHQNLRISLRKYHEELTSRGGLAPNRSSKAAPDWPCFLPFYQMIVRPTGHVSLCCSDPYGHYTMGDLNDQTPEEVWYGEAFTRKRQLLKESRLIAGDLCNDCDMVK